ncbi:DUF6906 family protein [Oceanobacillus jordanicus]|uniref:DUF6906 family protein n=1 Tax=Oceanobacillus jordanicus TaxID=2867266 RepID=UPI003B830FC4
MKHGKKPTRRHKDILTSKKLNPNNWLIVKDLAHLEQRLVVVHRETGNSKNIHLGGNQ